MLKTIFIPLSDSLPKRTYKIFKIEHPNDLLLRRMIDLGITQGAKIQPVHSSPTGNLKAYRIKNTVIALRNQDAQKILVYEIR